MTTVSRPADRPLAPTALSGITSKLQKILLVEVLVFLGNSAAAVALVIAMIASWVIPGRMLQQVNGAIRELGIQSR